MIQRSTVKDLPTQPGVYIFYLDETPIYIGKSVSIKSRVLSHITQAKISKKEYAIISQATRVEAHTTFSGFDALILESKLIKKHKPQYNVLWKDDKNYLYIKITIGDDFPRIYPVRKENDGKSKYFGPFSSTYMTQSLLYELRKVIPFCTQKRVGKRACFYSRIGLCRPCPSSASRFEKDSAEYEVIKKEYRGNVRKLITLLNGSTDRVTKMLEGQIKEMSMNKDYEKAIPLRNTLYKFSSFLDRRSFAEDDPSINVDYEKLFIEFVSFMEENFSEAWKIRLLEQGSGSENAANPVSNYRIECFDMSNLFGEHSVGSMVVAENGLLAKNHYKKFKIKYSNASDIHRMREVIERRLKHDEWGRPTLIVLDGGRPQLRTIHKFLVENNYNIPVMSIAKRPDRILIPSSKGYTTIYIANRPLFFKLIQGLRDESHRFAKKFHVQLRDRLMLH